MDELPIVDLDSFELSDISDNETICKLYDLTKTETNYILGDEKENVKTVFEYKHETI